MNDYDPEDYTPDDKPSPACTIAIAIALIIVVIALGFGAYYLIQYLSTAINADLLIP